MSAKRERSWTCSSCGLKTSFAEASSPPAAPAGWIQRAGKWQCLRCRRQEVMDAVASEGASDAKGRRRQALTEFELLRDPSASDLVIAKRVGCSTGLVRPVRKALREAGKLPTAPSN